MDLGLARQRVESAGVARLGTTRPDGRPHLVPCCFVLRDDIVYSAVDAKPKSTLGLRRIKNIVARPAFCLLVDHYDEDWSTLWWVRLDGTGRVVDSRPEVDQAKRALTAKYPQYHQVSIPGAVIALEIATWTSWP